MALESSASSPAPPPPPPGLYQARVVAPRGLHVRTAPDGSALRVLKFGDVVQVYEEKSGWGRIDPSQSAWVSTAYLAKIT